MANEAYDPGFEILASLDSLDLVVDAYESEIRESFDWKGVRQDAINNPNDPDSDGFAWGSSGITFLGTVFALSPSGKYYTPWACSNVDMPDAVLDQCFYEALDRVAESYDGWITSGEGDPCDLFFGCSLD